MGDLNHLYCARCSSTVIPGWWFALCSELATIPKRLATVSTWSDPCEGCYQHIAAHKGLKCLVVSMGFVLEKDLMQDKSQSTGDRDDGKAV